MKNKKTLIIALVVSALLVLVFTSFFDKEKASAPEDEQLDTQKVSSDEPLDIVFDFFTPWLEAMKSTTTDPYAAGLAENELLSASLRTKLVENKENEIDPVLCQSVAPEKIAARILFTQDKEAQILVTAKDKTITNQAVITLKGLNDGWYIAAIDCSLGEFAPDREFTFEREGYLLKSVPEPLNSEYWHIIFEENGVNGNAAPLYFDGESTCQATNGSTATCTPDEFKEATKIKAYGQMSEIGVEVDRIEFVK